MPRYVDYIELTTIPAINTINIIRNTRLKIDSWIRHGYHFHKLKKEGGFRCVIMRNKK